MKQRFKGSNDLGVRWRSLVSAGPFLRVFDQVFWSGAFFVFNLTASLVLQVDEYAFVAVSSSVAFVVLAVARNFSVNARIVAGSVSGVGIASSVSLKACYPAYVLLSAGVILANYAAWLFIGKSSGVSVEILICVTIMCVCMTFCDLPRQVLVYKGGYRTSLVLSVGYAGTSGVISVASLKTHTSDALFVLLWAFATFSVLATSLLVARGSRAERITTEAVPRSNEYSWRMGAEALYIGVASQASVVLLYATSDAYATEGVRLGYSLVYAPAVMLIQALQPFLLKYLSRSRIEGGDGSLKVVGWALSFCGLAFLGCAVAALLVSAVFGSSFRGLESAVAFLIPVGLAVGTNQALEIAISAARFRRRPQTILRVRSVLLGFDLACQTVGVVFFGVGGLVFALILSSLIRVASTVVIMYLPVSAGATASADHSESGGVTGG